MAWRAEYDEWGNLLGEENPEHLEQLIRLPGQQYDGESGLYYNRHRYYSPGQGRYITQDPIGLRGGWNPYQYPLNPISGIDPLGLKFEVEGDATDFYQAINYLNQDTFMRNTIDSMSKSEQVIKVIYVEKPELTRFEPGNMTLYWNNRAALFCSTEKDSKSQSPAMGLGHEIVHAQGYLVSPKEFMKRYNKGDDVYGNAEEARVITIYEQHAVKTLGECVREHHLGKYYTVNGPLETATILGTPDE